MSTRFTLTGSCTLYGTDGFSLLPFSPFSLTHTHTHTVFIRDNLENCILYYVRSPTIEWNGFVVLAPVVGAVQNKEGWWWKKIHIGLCPVAQHNDTKCPSERTLGACSGIVISNRSWSWIYFYYPKLLRLVCVVVIGERGEILMWTTVALSC